MRRAYGLLPWLIIALGVLHMAATWKFYQHLTPAALWFFNGGIVLVLMGAINLVHRQSADQGRGLRWLCRGVNLVILAFSILSGIVDGASVGSLIVVVGIMGAVTLLSFVPAAYSPAETAPQLP